MPKPKTAPAPVANKETAPALPEYIGGYIIKTKFHGPGNIRGARISAFLSDNKGGREESAQVSWDYSLESAENHLRAAQKVLEKINANRESGESPRFKLSLLQFSQDLSGAGFLFFARVKLPE